MAYRVFFYVQTSSYKSVVDVRVHHVTLLIEQFNVIFLVHISSTASGSHKSGRKRSKLSHAQLESKTTPTACDLICRKSLDLMACSNFARIRTRSGELASYQVRKPGGPFPLVIHAA